VSPDRVTVVVPTYNERENIADLAKAVTEHGYRLLIVDDNSPDGTGSAADDLAAVNGSISVLHRSVKTGLGPAYAAAFDSLDETSEVIVEMDADFSHDPADLPRLIAAIERGADLVIGSRYVPGGATPDWPLLRRLISKGGNAYARAMLGIPIRDATAGFRAFRANALAGLSYRSARSSGYAFQVEMAWRAVEGGLAIVEIPVIFRDRARGQSKMGFPIVVEAMWLVTVWGLARLGRKVLGR
jgi:dolichol-phosphate mannosyltransferase